MIIETDGNTFERTVDIVVAAIRDAEARPARPARRRPARRTGRRRSPAEASGPELLERGHAARQRPDDARPDGRARSRASRPALFAQRPRRGPRAHPAHGRRHPRDQPHLERRRLRHRLLDHAAPCATGGSTGWASASCSTGRSSAGSRRAAASTRSTASTADVEAFRLATRILEAGYVLLIFPEGTRSPDGRAPGGEGRPRDARAAHRTPRSSRSGSTAATASGRRAASSRSRSRAGRSRSASGRRSVPRTSSRRAPTAGPPRPSRPPRSWAGSPRCSSPRHRGVYAAAVRRRRTAIGRNLTRQVAHICGAIAAPVRPSTWQWEPCRTSASPSAPASATACARRSTRRRSRRPPARRRIRSARSCTTRASSATSQQIGVQSVESLDDVDHGSAVVIRAHGVKPEVFERAEARGLEVIDGTCTWVIQEQRQLEELVDGGLHRRPARHARSTPRSSACSASRPTRSWSTRRRTGTASRAASGWR